MTLPDPQLQGIQEKPAPGPYLQDRAEGLTRAEGRSQQPGVSTEGAWSMSLKEDLTLGCLGAKEEM